MLHQKGYMQPAASSEMQHQNLQEPGNKNRTRDPQILVFGFVAWLIRRVYYANLSSSFPEVPSATEIKERWKGEQIYTLRYQNDFALR